MDLALARRSPAHDPGWRADGRRTRGRRPSRSDDEEPQQYARAWHESNARVGCADGVPRRRGAHTQAHYGGAAFHHRGEGAKTIVNGESLTMEPGDFLLTPSWTWHGHIHQGAGPMLWLDVLDVPFVRGLDLGFYEEYSDPPRVQPADRPIDDNLRRYGAGSLLPPPKAELS